MLVGKEPLAKHGRFAPGTNATKRYVRSDGLLSGQERTRCARYEFFAFDPTADRGAPAHRRLRTGTRCFPLDVFSGFIPSEFSIRPHSRPHAIWQNRGMLGKVSALPHSPADQHEPEREAAGQKFVPHIGRVAKPQRCSSGAPRAFCSVSNNVNE
jgi:hypothetical protein